MYKRKRSTSGTKWEQISRSETGMAERRSTWRERSIAKSQSKFFRRGVRRVITATARERGAFAQATLTANSPLEQ
jgi:hypothetical protein